MSTPDPFIENALALVKQGSHDEAEALLARADAGAAAEAGVLLAEMKRYQAAVEAFDKALAAAPDDVEVWLERGAALEMLGRWDEALESYEKAVEIAPQNPDALFAAGVVLGRQLNYEDALLCFDAVLALAPDYPYADYNRGRMLLFLDRYEEAFAAFSKVLERHADDMHVWINRAHALELLGRLNEAGSDYEKAAEVGRAAGAGWALPLFHKGLMLLKRGAYREGFPLYAYRFAHMKRFDGQEPLEGIATWRGEPTREKVRVWAEQGVGDQIVFSRLASLMLARAPNLVWECDARLAPILQRAYPLMQVRAYTDPARDAASQISACELPAILGLSSPKDLPYPPLLNPRADLVADLSARYRALAQGRKIVGVSWRSSAPTGKHKSAPILDWAHLLQADYFFVSLQYGDVAADLAEAQSALDCTIYEDKEIDQMTDLEAFFAQVAAMDHVVTISNSTAHVAGALGKSAHVLVTPVRGLHWYWGGEGDRCAWHPSLRIVRRSDAEGWRDQVAHAADGVEKALRA